MQVNLFQRLQKGLLEKRHNLTDWVSAAPISEKQIRTGAPDAQPIQSHLDVIDNTLEAIQAGTLGVCDVCHDTVDIGLLDMDYTCCVCLEHYSAQEKHQLEEELEFSQAVQRALMPQDVPMPTDVDLAAFSRPAQIVSGDYFDFFKFKDGSDGLAIADAVGHGVSAGLLMSSMQTALRLLAPENINPATILDRVNRLFLHNVNFTTFVTVFLASYDTATRKITYSNAGHNPPLLYHPQDSCITQLLPTSAAVGLVEYFNPSTESLNLYPGDVLLLYTDGVTEARNDVGEFFGLDRLAELIKRSADLPSVEMVRTIRQGMETFMNGYTPQDDTTFVAIKIR